MVREGGEKKRHFSRPLEFVCHPPLRRERLTELNGTGHNFKIELCEEEKNNFEPTLSNFVGFCHQIMQRVLPLKIGILRLC